MRMTVSFLTFLCLIVSFAGAQDRQQQILRAQDLRDAEGLLRFLKSGDPEIAARAALAAASVQDTSHIPALLVLLDAADARVRLSSAFALGQMNPVIDSVTRRVVSAALLGRLAGEPVDSVLMSFIEVLGLVGDRESLGSLVQTAGGWRQWKRKTEAALSVGRYAYRGIRTPEATRFASGLLGLPSDVMTWKAAYALMRINDRDMLGPHTTEMITGAQDADANTRMHLASALGAVRDAPAGLQLLLDLAWRDPDWRVRVNALKSLSQYDAASFDQPVRILMQGVDDINEHISLTAIGGLAKLGGMPASLREDVGAILRIVIESPRYSGRQKREAALALARLRGVGAYPVLRMKMDEGLIVREVYVEALGLIPGPEALEELLDYASYPDPELKFKTLSAIISACNLAVPDAQQLEAARRAVLAALDMEDMAVISTAAEAAAEAPFAESSVAPVLLRTLRRLNSPQDTDPMVAVIRGLGKLKAEQAIPLLLSTLNDPDRRVAREAATALEAITGKPHRQFVAASGQPAYTNFDWQLLAWIRTHPFLQVITTKGEFRIELFPDDAPFTCISIARLVRRGFYQGLLFHRVVPNFVIQGGDPRGDGWGGPGYSIRSEFSLHRYDRGMVGMASSGKDTEGCQFFVTHSSQPHLDGRYTIFGKVIEGMDVVDRIQVADQIESVRFLVEAEENPGE